MAFFDRDFKEILGTQMFSIIGGLIAGTILAVYEDKLLIIPGMLIMIPGFLEMRNNIAGSFSSRITSGLFLHIIKPDHMKTKIIKGNVIASFILGILVSIMLGLIAFAFNYFLMGLYYPAIIIIPLIAGFISNGIEIPLTLIAILYLFKKGHDPNNIIGPFITAIGDVVGILSLLFALMLL